MTREDALVSAILGLSSAITVLSWQMQEATGEDLSTVREWADEARDVAVSGGKP